ncbi:MAG: hypothetical protein AB7P22_14610, partial [Vicinamibacterales bacterium]
RETWRLVVQLALPGLEFSDALVHERQDLCGMAALKSAAYAAGSGVRENSSSALLPSGTPFHEYVPRSGRIVTAARRTAAGTREPLDQLVWPQHRLYEALRRSDESVANRFLPDAALRRDAGPTFIFPRNLEPNEDDPHSLDNPRFPFVEGNSWIGFVHADISGLGEVWRDISAAEQTATSPSPEHALSISSEIERALTRAAGRATEAVLLPSASTTLYPGAGVALVPARPLVLGGDDLTVIVRSDLALAFTRRLLEAIEEETWKAFESLRNDPSLAHLTAKLPHHLSACAGIAFARSSQPFQMTSTLSEALCKFAKKDAKRHFSPYPSAIAFHTVSTTLHEDFEQTVLAVELTLPDQRRLTAQPLFLAAVGSHPTCEAFDRLVLFLAAQEKGRGKLRNLRAELFADPEAANESWRRWREVARREGADLKKLDTILRDLNCGELFDERVPFREGSPSASPLFDALQLIDLGHATALRNGEPK